VGTNKHSNPLSVNQETQSAILTVYISLKANSWKVSVSLIQTTKLTQINFVSHLHIVTKYIFKHGSLRSFKSCNEAWLQQKLVFLDKQMTPKRLKEHPNLMHQIHSILFSPILQPFFLFTFISTSFYFLPPFLFSFFFSSPTFFFMYIERRRFNNRTHSLSLLNLFSPYYDHIQLEFLDKI